MSGKQLSVDGDRLASNLEAIVSTHVGLSLLDGFPNIRVVVGRRRDDRVALVSGGGSGHEPAFAGFVGEGLLSAAVCGDVYAAPSVDAVLAAVQSVTGEAGCLLLPLNYTGDRLNFGLAAVRAQGQQYRVETVTMDDDCAIAEPGRVGRRGLAGSVLVIKILGAAAKEGKSLAELTQLAKQVIHDMGTVGVGLETFSLPGQPPVVSRLGPNEVELGLGIHGEPGVEKMKMPRLDALVDIMIDKVLNFEPKRIPEAEAVGVLVNNLGGMTTLDLNGILFQSIKTLKKREQSAAFGWMGTLVTSVTVAGFSITLLTMRDGYARLLSDPVDVPSWPFKAATPVEAVRKVPLPQADNETHPVASPITPAGQLMKRCVQAMIQAIVSNEQSLNKLDGRVGDGDCGSTLAAAAQSIEADIDRYPFDNLEATLQTMGGSISRSSGGTSGALYGLFLSGVASGMPTDGGQMNGLSAWAWATAKGMEAIKEYGGAGRGDRTMIDALEPALDALKAAAEKNASMADALSEMCQAAEEGVQSTLGMVAQLGRAAYVPQENLSQTPDPGAKAIEILLKAISNCLMARD